MEQLQNPYSIIVAYLDNIASTQTDILTRMNRVLDIAPSPVEEYLTTKQAKDFLKCSVPTLLKWRKEKFITAKFFGRSVRYLKSDLIKISQSRKSKINHTY